MAKKKLPKRRRKSNVAVKWTVIAVAVVSGLFSVGLGGHRLGLAFARMQHQRYRTEAIRLRGTHGFGAPESTELRAAHTAERKWWVRRRQWGGPYEEALHACEQIPEMVLTAMTAARNTAANMRTPAGQPDAAQDFGSREWFEYKPRTGTFAVQACGLQRGGEFSFGDTRCESASFVPTTNAILLLVRLKVPEGVRADAVANEYLKSFRTSRVYSANQTERPATVGSFTGTDLEANASDGRRVRMRCLSKHPVVYCQFMLDVERATDFDPKPFFDSLTIVQ